MGTAEKATGQGTWYILTHHPDNIIAAAPISGYSSIQSEIRFHSLVSMKAANRPVDYVPYDLWRPSDPSIRALLDASLSSYRHELLLQNAQSIPVLQQHGSVDDNVPAFHSRLMSQLIRQSDASSIYTELAGENHWFEGIMTTDQLSSFYKQQLNSANAQTIPPHEFTFTVANPADTGPKHGVKVLQLDRPGQLGRVDVSFAHSVCNIRTSNILSLELPGIYPHTHEIFVDNYLIDFSLPIDSSTLWKSPDGSWRVLPRGERKASRQGAQLGPMDAFLRTSGTIQIIRQSSTVQRIALQISRNLCQYFAADTNIVDHSSSEFGNSVRVAVGGQLSPSVEGISALEAHSTGVVVRTGKGDHKIYPSGNGLGAIFLRPLDYDAVELVVWGSDEEGLEIAARLVPMLTGVGQPDFVIADRKMLWGGAAEVLAMGFFDHEWNVSGMSYLT